jgi:hypothetical protein
VFEVEWVEISGNYFGTAKGKNRLALQNFLAENSKGCQFEAIAFLKKQISHSLATPPFFITFITRLLSTVIQAITNRPSIDNLMVFKRLKTWGAAK